MELLAFVDEKSQDGKSQHKEILSRVDAEKGYVEITDLLRGSAIYMVSLPTKFPSALPPLQYMVDSQFGDKIEKEKLINFLLEKAAYRLNETQLHCCLVNQWLGQ